MAPPEEMHTAMANRSIRTIKTELEYLTDAGIITPQTLSDLLQRMPPLLARQADSRAPSITDQSGSKLMTIPQELRDMIYEHVFDNPVVSPAMVQLENTAHPSKDTILACRQLYSEMKQMRVRPYREYWSRSRFAFELGHGPASICRLVKGSGILPSTQEMQHIQHFSATFEGKVVFDIIFEHGRWEIKVFTFSGELITPQASDEQSKIETNFKVWVLKTVPGGYLPSFDPRLGQGLPIDSFRLRMYQGYDASAPLAEYIRMWKGEAETEVRFVHVLMR